MAEPTSPQASNAAAVVAATVDGVVEATADAIEAANNRAEAAEQVAALVSEAAIQRSITDDVEELREEVEACQSALEEIRSQILPLQQSLATLQQSLTTLVTMEMLTAELSRVNYSPPTLPALNMDYQNPSQNPNVAGEEGHVALPQEKPSRFRLT